MIGREEWNLSVLMSCRSLGHVREEWVHMTTTTIWFATYVSACVMTPVEETQLALIELSATASALRPTCKLAIGYFALLRVKYRQFHHHHVLSFVPQNRQSFKIESRIRRTNHIWVTISYVHFIQDRSSARTIKMSSDELGGSISTGVVYLILRESIQVCRKTVHVLFS